MSLHIHVATPHRVKDVKLTPEQKERVKWIIKEYERLEKRANRLDTVAAYVERNEGQKKLSAEFKRITGREIGWLWMNPNGSTSWDAAKDASYTWTVKMSKGERPDRQEKTVTVTLQNISTARAAEEQAQKENPEWHPVSATRGASYDALPSTRDSSRTSMVARKRSRVEELQRHMNDPQVPDHEKRRMKREAEQLAQDITELMAEIKRGLDCKTVDAAAKRVEVYMGWEIFTDGRIFWAMRDEISRNLKATTLATLKRDIKEANDFWGLTKDANTASGAGREAVERRDWPEAIEWSFANQWEELVRKIRAAGKENDPAVKAAWRKRVAEQRRNDKLSGGRPSPERWYKAVTLDAITIGKTYGVHGKPGMKVRVISKSPESTLSQMIYNVVVVERGKGPYVTGEKFRIEYNQMIGDARTSDAGRLVHREQNGEAEVKVYWDASVGEYNCRLFVTGKEQPNATYFTDDLEDAKNTAKDMARRSGDQVKRWRKVGDAASLGRKIEYKGYSQYRTWYNMAWSLFPQIGRHGNWDTGEGIWNKAGQLVAWWDKTNMTGYIHPDAEGSNSSLKRTGDAARKFTVAIFGIRQFKWKIYEDGYQPPGAEGSGFPTREAAIAAAKKWASAHGGDIISQVPTSDALPIRVGRVVVHVKDAAASYRGFKKIIDQYEHERGSVKDSRSDPQPGERVMIKYDTEQSAQVVSRQSHPGRGVIWKVKLSQGGYGSPAGTVVEATREDFMDARTIDAAWSMAEVQQTVRKLDFKEAKRMLRDLDREREEIKAMRVIPEGKKGRLNIINQCIDMLTEMVQSV